MRRGQEKPTYKLLAAAILVCWTGLAQGIILHPNGEPNLVTWTNRPDPNVVGRWKDTASCVAISPNCIITTRHQGGDANTPVQIGGRTYTIANIYNHSIADIRVVKLNGANLTSFVHIYTDTNEVGRETVIGGYGDGRGTELINKGKVYGYTWDNSTNTTRRWGQNRVDSTGTVTNGYTSNIIEADFDGLGDDDWTLYECIIADHDSGGGWFIFNNNEWKVAGLSRGVAVHYVAGHEGDPKYILYEAWFRNRTFPQILAPDPMDAVRVSSYAAWIQATIPPRAPGDLTGDDWVDLDDFSVFAEYWQDTDCHAPDWCAGADSEHDSDIDWDDLAYLVSNWLTGL